MSSEAKMTPALDPTFIPENALDFDKCKVYSKIFRLDEVDSSGDNSRYQDLMESLYPYNPDSNFQLNPMGNAITKTWTKEGDLLIHVEYIEMVKTEEGDKADNHEF